MHAAHAHQAQGAHANGPVRAAIPTSTPQTSAPTRAQLHREVRETAGAIPVPLRPVATPKPAPTGRTLKAVQAPEQQVLREATLPELMWIEEMRIHLRHPADPPFDTAALSNRFDDFCAAWHNHSRNNRWDSTYAVASLGVGLGDLLIDLLPAARWVICESPAHSSFAVRDDHQRVTFLPLDAVARRWDNHQLDWISAFLEQATSETVHTTPRASMQA